MLRHSQIICFPLAVVFLALTLSRLMQAFAHGLALDYLMAAAFMLFCCNFFHLYICGIYFECMTRIYGECSH